MDYNNGVWRRLGYSDPPRVSWGDHWEIDFGGGDTPTPAAFGLAGKFRNVVPEGMPREQLFPREQFFIAPYKTFSDTTFDLWFATLPPYSRDFDATDDAGVRDQDIPISSERDPALCRWHDFP